MSLPAALCLARSLIADIHLHPLVVLSIADHYTREVAQNPNGSRRCVGLLFGQQNGRVVEVVETVEVTFTAVKGEPTIATEAVETDMKLCQERREQGEM